VRPDPSRDSIAPDSSAAPTEPARRKRRRVFRKGTGAAGEAEAEELQAGRSAGRSRDDTETGWSESAANTDHERDRWLQEQRPPHYE
jgi:hypothetical protein